MCQWFWHIYKPMHNQVLVYILCSLYWIQTKISNVNPMIVISIQKGSTTSAYGLRMLQARLHFT